MDEKGLIFTTDAVLALVIFAVFSSAILAYYAIPNYGGQDQQDLERLAADALRVMEYDGTLYAAASYYQSGNTSAANNLLTESLNRLIPDNTGYRMTINTFPSAENDRGILVASNVATRVEVLSAPQQGWMGRAWYKLEKAEFENQQNNVTTTLWNFHNWLTNFQPWRDDGLYDAPYWGGGSSPQNIQFSIPSDAVIHNAYFLIGSSDEDNGAAFGSDTVINNVNHNIANPADYIFLNKRPGTSTKMYNYQGNISAATLNQNTNNYYVQFRNISSTRGDHYDLPWFSIIGNYSTTFRVPKGVINERYSFNDAAGLAVPTAQDLGDGTNAYGRVYNLETGTVSSFYTQRIMDWGSFVSNRNVLDNFDDGTPFVIDNVNGADGSAVSVIQEFDLPTDTIQILDGAVFMNVYGGADNALVEVWDEDHWETVFCSFDFDGEDYSEVGNGYGNLPGIIYIGDRLNAGHNKVRVTVWDQVPSTDYDLVGMVDCYSTVTYTRLPIDWRNFEFPNYQTSGNVNTQSRTFTTLAGAKEVYLFLGTGIDTKNVKVEIRKGFSWYTLYNGPTVPYSINLASLDAAGPKAFTSGTAGNYTITPGTYRVRVTVTAPSNEWESGDYHAEIYSGTRVSVLYPEFLSNEWTAIYAQDAATARQNAVNRLVQILSDAGYTVDPSLIRSEALYTGDLPNSLPVRLDLWRS